METIHDVWRLLVRKAADGTLQPDEAGQALGIIDQHEASQAKPGRPRKRGVMSETDPEPAEETVPDDKEEATDAEAE